MMTLEKITLVVDTIIPLLLEKITLEYETQHYNWDCRLTPHSHLPYRTP